MSSIETLKHSLRQYQPVQELVESLDEHRTIQVRGVPGLLKAWVTAYLVESGRRVLWITQRSQSRETALSDLSQLLTDDEVGLLPAPGSEDDITPFEARIFRARALQHWTSSQPYALVTEPASTWLNLLPDKSTLERIRVALKPGTELGRDSLAERLVEAGYSRCDIVENRGDYALRGHILDLFPYTHDKPLRSEYWGERLESLRIFDPITQPKPHVQGDLIVSASRGVQLLTRLADPIDQRRLQNHVHVFVTGIEGELPVVNVFFNRFQARLDLP